jgi:hypothetical protein
MPTGLVIQGAAQATLEEALHETRREMGVRTRCYPNWIQVGKLSSFEASERYNRIKWAAEYLDRLSRAMSDEQFKPLLAQLGLVASNGQ